MKKYIKKIWELYEPFKGIIFVLVFLNLIAEIMFLFPPVLYGKVVDSIIYKASLNQSLKLVAAMFVLGIATTIVGHIKSYIDVKYFEYDIDRHIQNKSVGKILEFSIGQNTNENSGVKQSVINRGQNAIEQFTNYGMYNYLPMILKVLAAAAAMFFINIILGSIVLFGASIYILISLWVNKKFNSDMKKMEDLHNESNKEQMEILHNVYVIETNSMEKLAIERYDRKLLKIAELGRKIWIKYINLMRMRGFVSDITEFAVMGLGVYFVYKGMYTPGTLIIFWSWSSRVFNQLGMIGQMQRNPMRWSKSIKKYCDLMGIDPDIKEIENPVRLENIRGEIEFKNVSFKYPYRKSKDDEDFDASDQDQPKNQKDKKSKPALRGVSFKIEPGKKVAFVGESGAGKTTISQLLLRAYDAAAGEILIDGENIKNLDLKHYRRHLGLVPQDVGVFDRTLRENIVFSLDNQKDVSEERLKEVAKLSRIDKFKHRLEHGFDTIIGEKGIRLSGGERQRVGIARALIKDPSILIFDEATSHLDAENEKMIHEAIDKVSEGRTTIIIAHRLSTVKNADKIFVMDKGKIVGEGNHQELMKTCPVYQNLVSHQRVEM